MILQQNEREREREGEQKTSVTVSQAKQKDYYIGSGLAGLPVKANVSRCTAYITAKGNKANGLYDELLVYTYGSGSGCQIYES